MSFRQKEPEHGYRQGVGVLLFNRNGLIFVAERIDTPGAWQMPQGGLDEGEAPRSAAMRELAEETGITSAEIVGESKDWLAYDLPDSLRGNVWKGRFVGQTQKWFALRFSGDDGEVDLDAHEAEFCRWKWAAPDQLVDLIVPFKRALYEAVVQELAPFIKAGPS